VTLPAQRAGLRQPSLSEEFRLIRDLFVVVPPDVPLDAVGGDVVSDGADRVAFLPQLAGPVLPAEPGELVERPTRRDALQDAHNARDRLLRREFEGDVEMRDIEDVVD
jgi:hypothetical protein